MGIAKVDGMRMGNGPLPVCASIGQFVAPLNATTSWRAEGATLDNGSVK
jgi:hypothetical protein